MKFLDLLWICLLSGSLADAFVRPFQCDTTKDPHELIRKRGSTDVTLDLDCDRAFPTDVELCEDCGILELKRVLCNEPSWYGEPPGKQTSMLSIKNLNDLECNLTIGSDFKLVGTSNAYTPNKFERFEVVDVDITNNVDDLFGELNQIRFLKSLTLERTGVQGNANALKFTSTNADTSLLTHIKLTENPQLTFDNFQPWQLCQLPYLETLVLSKSSLNFDATGGSWKDCTNLTTLDLSDNTELTGNATQLLNEIPTLTALKLQGTKIAGAVDLSNYPLLKAVGVNIADDENNTEWSLAKSLEEVSISGKDWDLGNGARAKVWCRGEWGKEECAAAEGKATSIEITGTLMGGDVETALLLSKDTLESLTLKDTDFRGDVARFAKDYTKLRNLVLSNNLFHGDRAGVEAALRSQTEEAGGNLGRVVIDEPSTYDSSTGVLKVLEHDPDDGQEFSTTEGGDFQWTLAPHELGNYTKSLKTYCAGAHQIRMFSDKEDNPCEGLGLARDKCVKKCSDACRSKQANKWEQFEVTNEYIVSEQRHDTWTEWEKHNLQAKGFAIKATGRCYCQPYHSSNCLDGYVSEAAAQDWTRYDFTGLSDNTDDDKTTLALHAHTCRAACQEDPACVGWQFDEDETYGWTCRTFDTALRNSLGDTRPGTTSRSWAGRVGFREYASDGSAQSTPDVPSGAVPSTDDDATSPTTWVVLVCLILVCLALVWALSPPKHGPRAQPTLPRSSLHRYRTDSRRNDQLTHRGANLISIK